MQESALLAAVLGAPNDDGPRLVYADWLRERGDPRGEFIQVQCLLARLAADDPRRPALLLRERALWPAAPTTAGHAALTYCYGEAGA